MRKQFFGEYNNNGYSISFIGNRCDPVYQAGNCQFDSAQYLPVGSEGTVSLETLRTFCESTGKDIAREKGGIWKGCVQVDDFEGVQ